MVLSPERQPELTNGSRPADPTLVLLVDEQPIVRAGLRLALAGESDLEVVGEVGDIDSAMRVLDRVRPDVIVLGTELLRQEVFGAIERLRAGRGRAPVVLLVVPREDADGATRALHAGASGYVTNTVEPRLLLQAVRMVAAGGIVVTAEGARLILEPLTERLRSGPQENQLVKLSDREQAVLAGLAEGRSNAEIARDLYVAEATVKKHLSQVLHKLGLRDRLQAGLYGRDAGLGDRR